MEFGKLAGRIWKNLPPKTVVPSYAWVVDDVLMSFWYCVDVENLCAKNDRYWLTFVDTTLKTKIV